MSAKNQVDIEIRVHPENNVDSGALTEIVKNAKGTDESSKASLAQDKKKLYRMALNRIRTIMISLVLFFHCAASYQQDSAVFFLVQNLMRDWLVYVNAILGDSGWPMFVFYTLAGYAAYHSLRVRSVKDFVDDRSLRLVPPIFFGIFVLEAFSIYLMYYMGREYLYRFFRYESFLDFYLKFYSNCFSLMISECPYPRYVIGIYWYLIYLWVFCMLGIPLFQLWKKYPSPRLTTQKAKLLTVAGFLTLPFLVWGFDIAWYFSKDFSFLRLFSESNFYEYFFFIFFGFFLAWCQDAHEVLLDCCWYFVGFSIGMMPLLCHAHLSGLKYTRQFDIMLLLNVFAVYMFLAVWALAHKTLPYLPPYLAVPFDYIADRAIAIYVLHYVVQCCVLVLLYYIRGDSFLNHNTLCHLLLHYILSYILTLALYETVFCWRYTQVFVGMLRVSDIRPLSTPTSSVAKSKPARALPA